MTKMPSINDFFSPSMQQPDGTVRMLEGVGENKDRIYILNSVGRRLLQLRIKNESGLDSHAAAAQIKLIPYSIRRARVWGDQPDDPKIYSLSNAKTYEFTYHGFGDDSKPPKIHLVERVEVKNKYKTLVDSTLPLLKSQQRLVPLFSFLPGYLLKFPEGDPVKKRSHRFSINSEHPVQVDFYLTGEGEDPYKYLKTPFGLSLFYQLNYMNRVQRGVLLPAIHVNSVTVYPMRNYKLWVRCILSEHSGRPTLQFYKNNDYYCQFVNREVAWRDNKGNLVRKTLAEHDRNVCEELELDV